jgi:2-iminobutanoate/2-iminopropanoate deaminase
MRRQAITSDRTAPPAGPFSPAIRAGGMIYLSGQVGQDPVTGRLVEGDASRQMEQVLNNVRTVLEAAGRSLADVVRVGIYLTDMGDFHAINAIYGVTSRRPTRPAPPWPSRRCRWGRRWRWTWSRSEWQGPDSRGLDFSAAPRP